MRSLQGSKLHQGDGASVSRPAGWRASIIWKHRSQIKPARPIHYPLWKNCEHNRVRPVSAFSSKGMKRDNRRASRGADHRGGRLSRSTRSIDRAESSSCGKGELSFRRLVVKMSQQPHGFTRVLVGGSDRSGGTESSEQRKPAHGEPGIRCSGESCAGCSATRSPETNRSR
jgi:hypothetical protein